MRGFAYTNFSCVCDSNRTRKNRMRKIESRVQIKLSLILKIICVYESSTQNSNQICKSHTQIACSNRTQQNSNGVLKMCESSTLNPSLWPQPISSLKVCA